MKKYILFKWMCPVVLLVLLLGCDKKKEYHYDEAIYMNTDVVSLYYGDQYQVTASPTSEVFEWSSENVAVATVTAAGLIEAVGVGETNIIVAQGSVQKLLPIKVTIPTFDNVTAKPGNKRTQLHLEIKSNRVKTVRILRMDNNQSVDMDINFQSGTFATYFDGLGEGKYSFKLTSFDNYGNESQPKEVSVNVYGDTYRESLQQRQVKTVTQFGNGLAVSWQNEAGSWIEFFYTDTEGNQVSKVVTAGDAKACYLFDYQSNLSYATLYLPEATAVDTFRTEIVSHAINTDKRTYLTMNEPALVKACDFDLGGERVGFHDSDNVNSGGNYGYREGLGDYNSSGADVESALNIGTINKDEWLMYTVDVVDEGDYAIDFYVSVNGSNVQCQIEVDGTVSTTYNLVNNSSWSNWRYYCEMNGVAPPVFHLTKGKHKVKFFCNTGGFNFNGLRFTWQ